MFPSRLRRSIDWRPQSTSRDMEPLLLTPSLHATLPPPRRSLKSPNVTARERSTTSRSPSRNQTRERRARLEDVVAGSERVFPVRRLASDGVEAWAQVLTSGYEGYVAKDEASPYIGGRSISAPVTQSAPG